MNRTVRIGLAVLLVGAVLLVLGFVPRRQVHEAELLGVEMTVTETRGPLVPPAVGAVVMAAGAVVTAFGALRGGSGARRNP